jgi:hypothetical protein
MWLCNYQYLKIIGDENELNRLIDDYVHGEKYFKLNRGCPKSEKDIENYDYGIVIIHKSREGRVLMIETNYITPGCYPDELIFHLQEQYPTLMFHELVSCFNSQVIYTYTKIRNGKIDQGFDGNPVIDSYTYDADEPPWYRLYQNEYPLSILAVSLETPVNLRELKISAINKKL